MAWLTSCARVLAWIGCAGIAFLAGRAVVGLVADEGWGRALTDALFRQKLGELAVVLPWLARVGRRPRGSDPVVGLWRASLAGGAVLNAAAWFDLVGRASWAWWCWGSC